MTQLTIRIDEHLKEQAMNQAKKLGIPLSLILKNAIQNFVKKPQVVIGDVEDLKVGEEEQNKMNIISDLLH